MHAPSRPVRVPRRYLRALSVEVAGQMALMLLAVEALYLSDKMVTHLLFDALRNQLGVGFLIETLVLAAPEILSVGFPVAVVIAVYLALLRRREAGDFVILAAAGVAPRALIGFCLVMGLLALTVAGGLRGFVEPLAARHLATRLVEGRFEAVRQGQLTAGQFLTIDAATFYQQPAAAG
ncbi:MAG: LptF/LptG family permease, partial [Pararhodobacter sp.]|nr:LptF/LptG family permease [Pararhodobacter sp.]